MKNALIMATAAAIGLTSFFCLSETRPLSGAKRIQAADYNTSVFDTIPAKKKDTSKWKSKKTPYDSFGKPKTMDSIQIK